MDITDIQNGNTSTPNTSKSASFQKVEHIQSPRKDNSLSGYRLIDLNILSQIFNVLSCPTCESGSLELHEDSNKKHGLSNLFLKCSKCEYRSDFFTSSQVGRSFEVNKRIVYSTRSLGLGYTGIEKFNALMNMPPPMTKNNYESISNKLSSVAKEVAEETINDAVQDLWNKNLENSTDDTILDTGASCDGTWQRRSFSSNNGVFAAISLENGKVLNVEPMSKGCMQRNDLQKKDPTASAHWRNSNICKFNYNGTAGGMETEGAKRVFARSIDKNKVSYVEYLGDGDSKSYVNVKNVYRGIEIKKLECAGHYQKREETRLSNLKKKEKGVGGGVDSLMQQLLVYRILQELQ